VVHRLVDGRQGSAAVAGSKSLRLGDDDGEVI